MPAETIPRLITDTERRLRITRQLLERVADDLEQLEQDTDGHLHTRLTDLLLIVVLAREQLGDA